MNEPDGKAERTEAMGKAIEEAKRKATEVDDAKLRIELKRLFASLNEEGD